MSIGAEQRILSDTWKRARGVAWMMLAAPALYVTIGLIFLEHRGRAGLVRLSPGVSDALLFVFIGASVVCFLLAVVLRRSVLDETYVRRHFRSMGQAAQHYMHATFLVLSLCEAAAVMGFVYFLLTGNLQRMAILAGAGMAFSVFLFPSRSKLVRLVQVVKPPEGTT